MSRNRLLVGGLVIVAALVIAYFAFVYPPVSREDTSGAIGVAKKYRSEQITDRDVMLKDQEAAAAAAMAVMSPDEKAAMFERTSTELQARSLAQSPEVVAAAMGRADAATLARTFKGMDAQGRVEFFARAPKMTQEAVCKSIGVTSERFANFSMDEKAAKLAKAPDMELAAMVKNFDLQGKRDFFAKADLACRNDFVKLLDRNDKIAVMERAPVPVIAEMERANFTADFFGRATPEQQFEMLAKSPEVVAAAMGRADAATLARIYKSFDAQGRVEVFERSPKPVQDAFCKSANVTMERWAKFTMDEKASRLAKASNVEMAAMVKDATLQEKNSFFAKADLACRNDFVKLLDRNDKIAVMERAPVPVIAEMERANFTADFFGRATPEQQFEMLAKSPEVVAAAMGRADAATLARTFKGMDAQGRVEFFARAPKMTQEAVCKSIGVTSERFANFSMDEKAAKLAKAPDMELAAMVKNFDLQGKRDFFAKADLACRNDFVKLLDRNDRIVVMGRAPAKVTENMERAYSNFEKSARTQE